VLLMLERLLRKWHQMSRCWSNSLQCYPPRTEIYLLAIITALMMRKWILIWLSAFFMPYILSLVKVFSLVYFVLLLYLLHFTTFYSQPVTTLY